MTGFVSTDTEQVSPYGILLNSHSGILRYGLCIVLHQNQNICLILALNQKQLELIVKYTKIKCKDFRVYFSEILFLAYFNVCKYENKISPKASTSAQWGSVTYADNIIYYTHPPPVSLCPASPSHILCVYLRN